MSIKDTIQSVRQAVGREYIRPDPEKIIKLRTDLANSVEATDYLKVTRGFTEETIAHFQLGYDVEKNAISIPVFKGGELINIKYRYLAPEKAKYTSERGGETWLFNDDGLEHAKKKDGILVVEGEFDLMSVWQAGIHNVVSVASGKESYGVWVELLDRVPKVYIAFDNDDPGRLAGRKMAERVGTNKSYEVQYPGEIKDANDFFKIHGRDEFLDIIRKAKPYYTYEFKNLGNVINEIRTNSSKELELRWIPNVKIEKDWLIVVSGKTNVGKTSYCMNLAVELADKEIPTLVMPFERGTTAVGKRLLQVALDKTAEDLAFVSRDEWEGIIDKVADMPIYLTVPKKNDIVETIRKSRRFFGTRIVIVDHLDYLIRHSNGNRENEIANTLQDLKRLGEELEIIFIVVTHLRKLDETGRNPSLDDLKGSSSLQQDPECVVLLTSKEPATIDVRVEKNKGRMGVYTFGIREESGKMNTDPDDF
jgi:5S rRNA maturation endonuclease (ribonuclease M5)